MQLVVVWQLRSTRAVQIGEVRQTLCVAFADALAIAVCEAHGARNEAGQRLL